MRRVAAAAAAVLLLPSPSASAAEPHYGEPRNYAGVGMLFGSGFSSSSVASGDIDGDGRADLAVADFTSAVSVLRNTGRGFAPAVSYPTGTGSAAVVIANLDGQGAADVAVANAGAGTVSVLLSGRDGLTKAGDFPVGVSVLDVAAADLDRDGRTDLVVALDGALGSLPTGVARVQSLLGRGDGTFTAGKTVGGIGFLESIAVADVNRDGHPDAVGADIWTGAVAVALGTGDGGFRAPILSPSGSGTTDVAVADVNRDGQPDAVAVHGGDEATLLLGDGTGRFRPAESHVLQSGSRAPISGPQTVVLRDLDGNRTPDIAVAGGTPNVSVLLHR